jgi:hypothetical protein
MLLERHLLDEDACRHVSPLNDLVPLARAQLHGNEGNARRAAPAISQRPCTYFERGHDRAGGVR